MNSRNLYRIVGNDPPARTVQINLTSANLYSKAISDFTGLERVYFGFSGESPNPKRCCMPGMGIQGWVIVFRVLKIRLNDEIEIDPIVSGIHRLDPHFWGWYEGEPSIEALSKFGVWDASTNTESVGSMCCAILMAHVWRGMWANELPVKNIALAADLSLFHQNPDNKPKVKPAPPVRRVVSPSPKWSLLMSFKIKRYGFRPDLPDKRDLYLTLPAQTHAVPLPARVDLRPNMPLDPFDQGNLGACVMNACAGAVVYAQQKNAQPVVMPSRLYGYYFTRFEEGGVEQTAVDTGCQIRDAFKAANKWGDCAEDRWPYDISKFDVEPAQEDIDAGQLHRPVRYYRVHQALPSIKRALASGYPVLFGVSVYESFESAAVAKSGIVTLPEPGESVVGGHAVLAMGYDSMMEFPGPTKGPASTLPPSGGLLVRNSWGCYDDTTEILTDDGWVLFRDLKESQTVATLNQSTQTLEYQKITRKFEYDYSGDLLKYSAQGVDLLVTPNHKLYIGSRFRDKWRLAQADSIRSGLFRMKKDANWAGAEVLSHRVGDHDIPMDLWLEFLGYFISEGWTAKHVHERAARVRNRTNQSGSVVVRLEKARTQVDYVVGISQSKPETTDLMQTCLDRLPFSFSRNGTSWSTTCRALWEQLFPLGKQPVRKLPVYVRDLCRRQSIILLDAMILGDGTRGPQTIYYTSSPTLADDVQILSLKSGFSADVRFVNRIGRPVGTSVGRPGVTRHIEYSVSIKAVRGQPFPDGGYRPENIPYQGKVYCAEVPNHVIYVRRNGVAVWSGNSDWGDRGHFYIPFDYVTDADLATDFWVLQVVK